MATLYATDRALMKINGVDVATQIISSSWDLDNNARPVDTFTNDRTTQVVVLGNIKANATITETILEGGELIDWMNKDLTDAILEVHPASDSFNAPAQQVAYSGQVRFLKILAFAGEGENYSGAGNAGTRSVRFLLSNVTYVKS